MKEKKKKVNVASAVLTESLAEYLSETCSVTKQKKSLCKSVLSLTVSPRDSRGCRIPCWEESSTRTNRYLKVLRFPCAPRE